MTDRSRARGELLSPVLRRERIVELTHGHGRVTVEQLAALLGSSRETVRRDLSLLGEAGRVRKVHGGAVALAALHEGALAQRQQTAIEEKTRIAEAAAALFGDGDTIFVDVGTTTSLFARALARRQGVTIITNGTAIAQVLGEAGVKVFLIGGEHRADQGETIGPLAIEQIERFHAAHAVLTVGALGTDGPMDFDLEEAQVARAMIRQARAVTLLADGSKLGRAALFQLCPLDVVDRLITDAAPPEDLADRLSADQVEVVIAGA